jgi:hypothetical protein
LPGSGSTTGTANLDRILAHYSDDFVMSSPLIAQVANEPSGTLRGKLAIREYWRKALERTPNLRFELSEAFVGARSVVIHYRGVRGASAEVLFFDADGSVVEAGAHYL